jgi:hypothetical protein
MKNKNLSENNPMLDLATGLTQDTINLGVRATTKPVRYALEKERDNRTYNKLLIKDIISYAINKHKYSMKDCNKVADQLVRYNCKIKSIEDKIDDLKTSIKYCKHTVDESVCKLRLMQKIDAYNESIFKLRQKIRDYQVEEIEANNARYLEPESKLW